MSKQTTVIIETDRTAGAVQVIAAETLGITPFISLTGRLGVEVTLVDPPRAALDAFRNRLRRGGGRVLTTRQRA